MKKILTDDQVKELIDTLKERFEKNMIRHPDLKWDQIETKIKGNPDKLFSLFEMERTGGEPDVIGIDPKIEFIFVDCLKKPEGRRNTCYDDEALESRKKFKPEKLMEKKWVLKYYMKKNISSFKGLDLLIIKHPVGLKPLKNNEN